MVLCASMFMEPLLLLDDSFVIRSSRSESSTLSVSAEGPAAIVAYLFSNVTREWK